MAIVEDQKVKVKWNGRNIKHYQALGYIFSKLGDEFEVNLEHLTKNSKALVQVQCDYCNEIKKIKFAYYNKQVINNGNSNYSCKKCIGKRRKEDYDKNSCGLKIAKKCITSKLNGIIYNINYDNYHKLDTTQRVLIDEIIRYCEENNKFPSDRDLTNKNGYVSRTQFYKTFNIKTISELNYVIEKLQKSKPKELECIKCGLKKKFDDENFSKGNNQKYGLRKQCKSCEAEYALKRRYKRKGIYFNKITDITPEQWWEYYFNKKISIMPDFCFTDDSIIKITRYVFLTKLKLTKFEICSMKLEDYKKFKLYYICRRYNSILDFLKMCFPEMHLSSMDLLKSKNPTDEEIIDYIKTWLENQNLTTNDVLECKFKSKIDFKLDSLANRKFHSYINLFCWYFETCNILHPYTMKNISIFDFKIKPNNFWSIRENRVQAIKRYCENNGILKVLNNTTLLKNWIYNYFKQTDVYSVFDYGKYYENSYQVIIDAYPEIEKNKLLFFWEWHQCNENGKEFLITSLREMIVDRENISNPKDISTFLRYSTLIENGYVKFAKHVQRGRFSSFFEWACLSFPEFKDLWSIEDFGGFYTKDGEKCDSLEEVKIYEYIKYKLSIKNIKAIGTTFSGEHIFKLPSNETDNWYCPDFVIYKNGVKYYIEYFGLFVENTKDNDLLIKYKDKTKRKITYYNSTNENFIYLFPKDLKNNNEGIRNKILTAVSTYS